jgi:tetraacyldisaccharide-1-P 4'-kinase
LKVHGLEVVAENRFPDHHAYTQPEVHELEQQSAKLHAALVTTAKDAVRLSALTSPSADWCVAALRIEVEGGWNVFLEQLVPELFTQKKGGAKEPLPEIVPGDLRKF